MQKALLNTSKVMEFFDAQTLVDIPVNIIGCGAIGSHVAEQLTRLGLPKVHIWDFDTVEPKNVTNQMFTSDDIGKSKVDAVADMMLAINPCIEVIKHPKGVQKPFIVNGYIILCVDNIELRKEILMANIPNPNAKAFADFRMRLTDAQYYFSDKLNKKALDSLVESMNFTHEEAIAATPVSACGVELSVIYTVKAIVSIGMANFVKYFQGVKDQPCFNTVTVDMVGFYLDAFVIE